MRLGSDAAFQFFLSSIMPKSHPAIVSLNQLAAQQLQVATADPNAQFSMQNIWASRVQQNLEQEDSGCQTKVVSLLWYSSVADHAPGST